MTDQNKKEIVFEINQLIKLKHDNIVRYIDHDYGCWLDQQTKGFYYIFMEFMEGKAIYVFLPHFY